ncbi:MAG: tetratricopeptide repeat protein [Acidobacteriota bacterium]|nr:MAG: tetratricopeptide repeat protein [Acidobacteriota bacterium]
MIATFLRLALVLTCCLIFDVALLAGEVYELRGKVLLEDGSPIREVVPVVFLEQSLSPFTLHELVDRGGNFKFKRLVPANYRIIVSVPDWGQMAQSIDVGPSSADPKRRVYVELTFVPGERGTEAVTISPSQLAVPEEARDEYRKAIEAFGKRKKKEGVEHLQRALEIAPQYSRVLNHLGTIAYNDRRYAEAEKYFRQALECAPESYMPLVNLGGVLLTLRKMDEALQHNLSAVKRRPDDPLAHSQLGQAYLGLSDWQKAEEHLKRAKALDPAHFSYPQLVLAEVYRLRGEKENLVRELEDFLSHHPDAPVAASLREILESLQEGRGDAPKD